MYANLYCKLDLSILGLLKKVGLISIKCKLYPDKSSQTSAIPNTHTIGLVREALNKQRKRNMAAPSTNLLHKSALLMGMSNMITRLIEHYSTIEKVPEMRQCCAGEGYVKAIDNSPLKTVTLYLLIIR